MKLSTALKNREGRYKPNDPTVASLKRIHKINFAGQIFLSDKKSNTDMILVRKGDLVISGINVEKGALAVYEGQENISATIHYSSYIFDTEKIDIDFLKVFLRSPDFVQLLKEQVPGGIKTEIKPKHILSLEVYFPDTVTEQKAIAQHFFEKEQKFNRLNRHITFQLDQLEILNQTILQEAVQGKLLAQDPDDEPASYLLKRLKTKFLNQGKKEKTLLPIESKNVPFKIPKGWVWCRLGEIATNVEYGTSQKAEMSSNHIPVLRMNNIQSGKIDYSNLKYVSESIDDLPRLYLENGDMLFNRTNSYELVGKTAIYRGTNNSMTFASYLIRVQYSGDITPEFFSHYINSPICRETQLEPEIIQQNGQANFNGTKLKNILVPLPPVAEQRRIVMEIEKQFSKTKKLMSYVLSNHQATEQLLKALLHQAFDVKELKETSANPGAKVVELVSKDLKWDNLVAEPFEKYAAHPANNIQDKDWEMALMVACMKNKLGVTYGDVGLQKNVFNTNNLKPIFSKQYSFINSNFGTYSYELKDDLKHNPYLTLQKLTDNKAVYVVNPKYNKELLNKLSAKENKEFVQAINAMLSIYEHPFINKETDKIELYNTVLKVALDRNTTDIQFIYQGMKDWKIKQPGYKTKAEKFSRQDSERMLKLLIEKGVL